MHVVYIHIYMASLLAVRKMILVCSLNRKTSKRWQVLRIPWGVKIIWKLIIIFYLSHSLWVWGHHLVFVANAEIFKHGMGFARWLCIDGHISINFMQKANTNSKCWCSDCCACVTSSISCSIFELETNRIAIAIGGIHRHTNKMACPHWFVCILFNFRNFRFIITKPKTKCNSQPANNNNNNINPCKIPENPMEYELRICLQKVCHRNRAISGQPISARPQSHCNGPSRRIPARISFITSSTGMTHTPIMSITSEFRVTICGIRSSSEIQN